MEVKNKHRKYKEATSNTGNLEQFHFLTVRIFEDDGTCEFFGPGIIGVRDGVVTLSSGAAQVLRHAIQAIGIDDGEELTKKTK